MKCPLCKTEAKIEHSENVFKKGRLYRRVVYVCRDKNCDRCNKEVGREDIELDVTVEE